VSSIHGCALHSPLASDRSDHHGAVAIGIDVGGTFTDLVFVEGARVTVGKVATTPDQSVGVIEGAIAIGATGQSMLVHGTTVATNALLEHKGAKVVMITDGGFRDLIEIGRSDRPALYDTTVQRPVALVDREDRLESTDPDLVEQVLARHPDVVVVALKDAYRDGTAESALKALIRRRADVDVILSHEIANEFREFERASTAVTAGFLRPVVDAYLRRLATAATPGIASEVLIMRSNGGVAPIDTAAANPTTILLSGPAGGVAAAAELATRLAIERVISFDMGGTSTDVCRIEDGTPVIAQSTEVGGYPCLMPTVSIHTVGAGGGSIAWVDPGGALRVGPQSAGAVPGPAGYGRGGVEPTVTDANIVLGRIDPSAVFGDGVAIDREAAERAVSDLGSRLGMSTIDTAIGIIEVVESHMERAIGQVSVSEGYDARSASLVAFGGAGGLHAAALSTRLGMASVIIPNHAGVFSAVGLLLSPTRVDVTVPSLDLEPAAVDLLAVEATRAVSERFAAAVGFGPESVELVAMARYAGQSHEVAVPIDRTGGGNRLIESFGFVHEQRNGFQRQGDPVELVAVRATATAGSGLEVPPPDNRRGAPTSRLVHTGAGVDEVAVHQRATVAPAAAIPGPAVVEDGGSTIWIPAGYEATVLIGGELELRR
jgi:N-methylhydantoinase A